MPGRRFYVVRGKATHGTITHKCPTAEMALETLRRFAREAVQDVTLHDPDGTPLSAAELEALVGGAVPATPAVLVDPT